MLWCITESLILFRRSILIYFSTLPLNSWVYSCFFKSNFRIRDTPWTLYSGYSLCEIIFSAFKLLYMKMFCWMMIYISHLLYIQILQKKKNSTRMIEINAKGFYSLIIWGIKNNNNKQSREFKFNVTYCKVDL